jgi:hypothetical protein
VKHSPSTQGTVSEPVIGAIPKRRTNQINNDAAMGGRAAKRCTPSWADHRGGRLGKDAFGGQQDVALAAPRHAISGRDGMRANLGKR